MVRIKVCGITRLEDARFCAGAGAHLLGFVQDEGSPRYIRPAAAREMIEWLHGIETVGVFRDASAEEINRICSEVGFTMAQLDGTETPEVAAAIALPVIKRIAIHHDASVEQLLALATLYTEAADFILLDTARTSLWGGEGESLSWRAVRALTAEFDVFLDGDIDAINLKDAVETMRPFGVDVGAALESAPGIKDFDRIETFFDAVRELPA